MNNLTKLPHILLLLVVAFLPIVFAEDKPKEPIKYALSKEQAERVKPVAESFIAARNALDVAKQVMKDDACLMPLKLLFEAKFNGMKAEVLDLKIEMSVPKDYELDIQSGEFKPPQKTVPVN